MEVEARSQAVHLQKHLSQEQTEKQELCIVWKDQNGLSLSTQGQISEAFPTRLTEETGQPPGLVVMNDGHAQRVESHQAQHCPVECLRLHHAADRNAQETLLSSEICRWTSSGTPDAHSRHGDTLGY